MAAAAVLCLALGGAGGWVGHALHGVPAVAVAEAPATQDAVAAFRTFVVEAVHPVEVRADEKPHLVTWLSKRLGHAVAAPDLSAQGFRMAVAGACCRLAPSRGAMLMYDDDRGTRLTLYSRVGDGDGRTHFFRFAPRGRHRCLLLGRWWHVLRRHRPHRRGPAAHRRAAVDAQVRGLAPDRRQP